MLQQHIQFLYPQYLFQAHYSTPPKNVESDSILPIRNYLFSTCDEGLGTINGVQDPNLRSAKQGRRKQSVILCAYFLRISTLLNKHEIGNLGELLKNGQVVVCISTLNLYATCSANVKPYNPSGWQLRMLQTWIFRMVPECLRLLALHLNCRISNPEIQGEQATLAINGWFATTSFLLL